VTDVVGFLALCLVGTLAGTLFAFEWALNRMPPPVLATVLPLVARRFGPNLPPPPGRGIGQLPPLAIGSFVLSLVFTILARDSTTPLVLGIVATVGIAVGIAATTIFLGPINARLSSWQDGPPAEPAWEGTLERWFAFNLLRAFAAGIAFLSLAAAMAFGL
jgi:hypothetical protein